MSKKSRSTSRAPQNKGNTKPKKSFWRRLKRHAFSIGVLAFVVGGSAFGILAYRDSWATSHDLSVIGAGKPVVVQVHDPSCPKCNKLMSNTKIALKPHSDSVLFRIADIKTPAGRNFQRDNNDVQRISLVLFDGSGRKRSVLSGVQTVEILKREFERLAPR